MVVSHLEWKTYEWLYSLNSNSVLENPQVSKNIIYLSTEKLKVTFSPL